MKLYVTYGSPYARLARMIVIEKALEDRIEIIEAKTRTPGSPYYQINPSGRVPYLIDDAGVGMEDSVGRAEKAGVVEVVAEGVGFEVSFLK